MKPANDNIGYRNGKYYVSLPALTATFNNFTDAKKAIDFHFGFKVPTAFKYEVVNREGEIVALTNEINLIKYSRKNHAWIAR